MAIHRKGLIASIIMLVTMTASPVSAAPAAPGLDECMAEIASVSITLQSVPEAEAQATLWGATESLSDSCADYAETPIWEIDRFGGCDAIVEAAARAFGVSGLPVKESQWRDQCADRLSQVGAARAAPDRGGVLGNATAAVDGVCAGWGSGVFTMNYGIAVLQSDPGASGIAVPEPASAGQWRKVSGGAQGEVSGAVGAILDALDNGGGYGIGTIRVGALFMPAMAQLGTNCLGIIPLGASYEAGSISILDPVLRLVGGGFVCVPVC